MQKQTIYRLSGLGVLLLGGVLLLFGSGVIIGDRESQDATNLELGLWTPDTTIEQTFIASMDNLSRVDFRLDSYHPWDSPYLDCRLFEILSDHKPPDLTYAFIQRNRREVRYKRVNGWLLSGHMFNEFAFAPIADSRDKRYLLSITSPGLRQGGTSILLASSIDRYLYNGNLFVNGERQDGDLAFRVLYSKPRFPLLQRSFQRIALQKPGVFSAPVTYSILAVLYLLLLMFFLYRIISI